MLKLKVKYPNDDTKYIEHSFKDIKENCIYLDCNNNKLTSLKEIENLTQLQELYCNFNKLTSLKGIENLTQLQELYCSYNPLISLREIQNLTKLQYLDCSYNQLTSLEPLRNLIYLKKLNCIYNKLTSLEDIKNLIQLQILDCYNNELISLKGIENLTQLQYLNCNINKLISLKGIENLTQLHYLECSYNKLSSLPLSLMNCRNLTSIYYNGNNITDLPLQLLRFINRIRQGNINNINVYNDTQNIHNSSIQLTVINSINRLSQKFREPFNFDELTKMIIKDSIINCKERLIEYMSNKEEHSILLLNFAEILWLVWQEINEFNKEKQIEAKKRLNEEIKEADCMCYTGRCNRLINCLVGFSDLVEIKIQDSSQIGNIIVIVKERLGEEYTVDKHKEEVKKELLERGYNLETINEWIEYIE
jgi:Leucine-rich repeat (LRR) protein